MLTMFLFIAIFAAEFVAGFYISYFNEFMHPDALSRVANAFYVLYSRDPHLAAIGFVWNPLPSFMEIIPLLFYPLFPALAYDGLSAVIVSSLFAGLNTVLLYSAGQRYGLPGWFNLTFSLLFSLNPFIFLFGFNGLSDVPFIFFLMYTVVHFTHWMDTRHPSNLIFSGFGLALAFWTRYEAVLVGAALAFSIVALLLAQSSSNADKLSKRWKETYFRIESSWIVLLLPAVFSGLLWLLFNKMFTGNSLYFLNSEYSNSAQSASLKTDVQFSEIFSNPLVALKICFQKTLWFSAPLFGVLLVRVINKRLFRSDVIAIMLVFCSVPALQFLLLLNSSSFAWFRYFMYVFPLTAAWIPYELSKVKSSLFQYGIVICSLIVTIGLLGYAITDPSIAPDENTLLTFKSGQYNQSIQLDRSVAAWLDEQLPDKTILTDSASAYMIIMSSKNPRKFLITSDFEFKDAVSDPPGKSIEYILLPKPPGYSTINSKYPDMFENGSKWATLYKTFQDSTNHFEWRLYQVN
ncbi:hypothetical protein EYB31_33165 [Paenibacillus thalictri]|uniref:Glycosyltransferase RgtA/B/C/D-like domain-containing protein n=2 Tax=Paenibacillus thalictri TaxID=2527873 RepID=A0A4Q9DIR3_9BACL|nr:hypothetical protein EYB31_33165 [Paenibacillus thalictri]